MSEEQTNTKVDLGGQTEAVEIPKMDLKPYIGNESKINVVEEHKGTFGYYIKVISETLGTFNDKPVTASRIFSLVEVPIKDSDKKKIGWGTESKLAAFLKEHGVSHYKDLVGKDIVIVTTPVDSEGNKYLSF